MTSYFEMSTMELCKLVTKCMMMFLIFAFGEVSGQVFYRLDNLKAIADFQTIGKVRSATECAVRCTRHDSCHVFSFVRNYSLSSASQCKVILGESYNDVSFEWDSVSNVYADQTVIPNCSAYLVSGPNGVRDNQLTSQSVYEGQWKGSYQPSNARLTSPKVGVTDNAWCRGFGRDGEWIQVDFERPRWLSGVVTMGRNSSGMQYVTEYRIRISMDGINWTTIQTRDNKRLFTGNFDTTTTVTNYFKSPLLGRYLRLIPISWKNGICLRFDVLGCL